jgi:signal transduction histidine kinase
VYLLGEPRLPKEAGPVNVQASLWRSIAVFRVASLAYAALLLVVDRANYAHLGWAWAVLAGMAAWTAFTTAAYAVPARRTRPLLAADLVVTAAALASTALLQYPSAVAKAAMPVTATWVAGPVLAWAVAGGIRAGVVAALVLGACDLTLRHQSLASAYKSPALNGTVLLLLAGVVVGYVSTLAARAERAVQRATELEAASRERERLARGIHDSVLQVLALVQRRGAEVGGEAAEIGRLAGEQEAALRALIAADADGADGDGALATGELDLRALLTREASASVSVVTPAGPVLLPGHQAREVTAAVHAALDNVRRHCDATARAWVLVDDEGEAVTVTIRDDGPGIAAGRLALAAADGRLGVSQAICGRMRDLGGSAQVTSAPGTGTEVRLRLPRPPPARGGSGGPWPPARRVI